MSSSGSKRMPPWRIARKTDPIRLTRGARVVAKASRVRQQVAHAYVVVHSADAGTQRSLPDPFRGRVVQRQDTVFDQQHRQRRPRTSCPCCHPASGTVVVERNPRLPVRKPHRGAKHSAIRESHRGTQARHLHLGACFFEQRRQGRLVHRQGSRAAREKSNRQALSHGWSPFRSPQVYSGSAGSCSRTTSISSQPLARSTTSMRQVYRRAPRAQRLARDTLAVRRERQCGIPGAERHGTVLARGTRREFSRTVRPPPRSPR